MDEDVGSRRSNDRERGSGAWGGADAIGEEGAELVGGADPFQTGVRGEGIGGSVLIAGGRGERSSGGRLATAVGAGDGNFVPGVAAVGADFPLNTGDGFGVGGGGESDGIVGGNGLRHRVGHDARSAGSLIAAEGDVAHLPASATINKARNAEFLNGGAGEHAAGDFRNHREGVAADRCDQTGDVTQQYGISGTEVRCRGDGDAEGLVGGEGIGVRDGRGEGFRDRVLPGCDVVVGVGDRHGRLLGVLERPVKMTE